MTREEAIERFSGIINAMSISVAQAKFYPTKAELDELCDMAIEALSDRPTDEWCTDCKEYDHEKHCCPRFNRVIRTTLNEVVRCKDCIHWKADNEVFELGFCCVFPQKWVAETFYCADGERREL